MLHFDSHKAVVRWWRVPRRSSPCKAQLGDWNLIEFVCDSVQWTVFDMNHIWIPQHSNARSMRRCILKSSMASIATGAKGLISSPLWGGTKQSRFNSKGAHCGQGTACAAHVSPSVWCNDSSASTPKLTMLQFQQFPYRVWERERERERERENYLFIYLYIYIYEYSLVKSFLQCLRTCHRIHRSCPRLQEFVHVSQKLCTFHTPP